jgi:hypothetical protein
MPGTHELIIGVQLKKGAIVSPEGYHSGGRRVQTQTRAQWPRCRLV